MKKITYLLGVFFLITSCGEKEIPRFINENSDTIIKYKIDLSNNIIYSYSKYWNDNFIEQTNFIFNDSNIIQITTNSSNIIIRKKIYFLGDYSYAYRSIDSSYYSLGLIVTNIQYSYSNEYLESRFVSWRQFGDNPDSASYIMINKVESGNIIGVETRPYDNWSCTDYYKFNSQINKIDIDNFSNQVIGTINKNLIEHISWHPDCHSLPSTSTPYSDFKYELDDNGYVIKKIETYTPGYHSSSEEVTRMIKTTIFEYNLN